jgi:hypothetical protein
VGPLPAPLLGNALLVVVAALDAADGTGVGTGLEEAGVGTGLEEAGVGTGLEEAVVAGV